MRQYPFRIVYSVGSLKFTWVRYGESKERVKALAKRALENAHGGHAKLVEVEKLEGP